MSRVKSLLPCGSNTNHAWHSGNQTGEQAEQVRKFSRRRRRRAEDKGRGKWAIASSLDLGWWEGWGRVARLGILRKYRPQRFASCLLLLPEALPRSLSSCSSLGEQALQATHPAEARSTRLTRSSPALNYGSTDPFYSNAVTLSTSPCRVDGPNVLHSLTLWRHARTDRVPALLELLLSPQSPRRKQQTLHFRTSHEHCQPLRFSPKTFAPDLRSSLASAPRSYHKRARTFTGTTCSASQSSTLAASPFP